MDPADHARLGESLRLGIEVAAVGGVADVLAGQRIAVSGRAPGIIPSLSRTPQGFASKICTRESGFASIFSIFATVMILKPSSSGWLLRIEPRPSANADCAAKIAAASIASASVNTIAGLHEHAQLRARDRWASYVVGVVQAVLQRVRRDGRRVPRGLRLLVDSTVPAGRGVASSAALEVAAGAAVARA